MPSAGFYGRESVELQGHRPIKPFSTIVSDFAWIAGAIRIRMVNRYGSHHLDVGHFIVIK
jgi:hypothetical protein